MTRPETTARIGPLRSDSGDLLIWVRTIRGHTYAFWSWPDQLAIYRINGEQTPQHIRTFPKET